MSTNARRNPLRGFHFARRLPRLLALLLAAACSSPRAATPSLPPPTAPVRLAPTATAVAPPASPLPSLTPPATAPPQPSATPILEPSPTGVPEITLLFTGDINPARCVYWIAKAAGDMALPYRALADVLRAADVTIGSLDGAISDVNPPTPCAEFHRNLLAPAEAALGLQFAGFDVISAATNHIKDCGLTRGCQDESMLDTLAHLRAAGIAPVGAGRHITEAVAPVFVDVRGVRFAFLAFSGINEPVWATDSAPGNAPLRRDAYEPAIRAARAQSDVVIVLPHWGREFDPAISAFQARAAGVMVEAGATLVVGNNPHRVQGVETFANGAVVAYALGNFVFDMQWSDGSQFTVQGVMLKATFRGAELRSVELIPIHIHDNFQPRLAPPEEAAQILRDVDASTQTLPPR